MAIKLVVIGAGGRMGKRLVALGAESPVFEVVGAVDNKDHPELGVDAGFAAGVAELGVQLSDSMPPAADVAIDFSLPEAADKNMEWCEANGVSLVMGTTGLTDDQKAGLSATAEKVSVVFATNMSVGMNVLFSLVGKAAAMLGEAYDIEIVEQHHRFKKDAPSGSALTLAEHVCEATGRDPKKALVCGREGRSPRKTGDVGMHAVRAGDIVGVHSVMYSTLGETVTLNHTAHTRDTFVRGALRAAEWVAGRKAGLYSMQDVLGIK